MPSDFKKKLDKLEQIFKIKIDEPKYFKIALTHSSYTRENDIDCSNNYERLEFLGDAVLKLGVSEILYKKFCDYPEGELTKIRSIVVSDNTLAEIARKLGISELLILGKQEEKTGGRKRKSILACALESLLGAFYLDNKYQEILEFLEKELEQYIEDTDKHFEKINAKATLQEYTQSINKQTPEYIIVEEKGPEHNKTFKIEVFYGGKLLGSGEGRTKKEAEQHAALKACKELGVIQ